MTKLMVRDIGDGFFECLRGGEVTYNLNDSTWNSYARAGNIYEEAQLAHWAGNGAVIELEDGTMPELKPGGIYGVTA